MSYIFAYSFKSQFSAFLTGIKWLKKTITELL